jgi:hypothetical protein
MGLSLLLFSKIKRQTFTLEILEIPTLEKLAFDFKRFNPQEIPKFIKALSS